MSYPRFAVFADRAFPIALFTCGTASAASRYYFYAYIGDDMKDSISLTGIMAVLSVSILVTTVAGAQNRPPLRDTPVTPPSQQECSTQVDPTDRSKAETQGQGGGNLSEKLSKSEGVICPPRDVDPDIAKPPRGGGKTPVIPPPGTPGGDPNVRPK
jgi:hypothetical protein